MNFKRRKRRRGGIKGCCGMCMLKKTDGRRNGRRLSAQEIRAKLGWSKIESDPHFWLLV